METPIPLTRAGLRNLSDEEGVLALPLIEDDSVRLEGVKRVMDLVGAGLALVLLAPLMLVVAALIRLDSPGPAVFQQVRIGRSGRPFRIFKFRTMVADAEERLALLEACNEASGGVLFKMTNDPRVTRLGRFLRRTSLDELPQLINVLRGQMSLVGPRPLSIRDCERMEALDPASYSNRLEALPGLTGLAQISGRRDLEPERILELDLRYVQDRSIGLDVAILIRTVSVVLDGQGAD
jgi:lipopolysaccharide/colanic/teichoic acid biosynthesis glycosyltransferase